MLSTVRFERKGLTGHFGMYTFTETIGAIRSCVLAQPGVGYVQGTLMPHRWCVDVNGRGSTADR